ncbi:glycoside hydrolase family 3 C-terminal domain-containing protein [Psychromonas aquimarina]|uniref:glycoside hydrolase family 3 C-terminal domain-containing protein n=1 Tax=Psychromonas aquimarina TaxID=444919 RepID=UPI0004025BE9|nr:glycoside hydrolase family 3 C-terminal domain-containing protein [Psychromonas aquimarina]
MSTPKSLLNKKYLSTAISAALLSVVVSGCNNDGDSTLTPENPIIPETPQTPDTPDTPQTPDAAERIDTLISKMTLQQKIDMMTGAQEPVSSGAVGYIKGVPELGIPPLRLTDGPAGIRLVGTKATSMPAPVAMAASFDTKVARAMGRATGAEGKALGQDVLLSPMVNIVRVPQAGRNFETLGEDPLLAGTMVAQQIKGIQEKGLIATVKHYVANNQEDNRQAVNATIDERTLNEVYLPAFKDAVDAGVGAFMCAYNKVNDTSSCENAAIQNDIARERWGFEGFIMSDWGATHSSSKAVTNGQDMDMPGNGFGGMMGPANFDNLKNEVEDGRLEEAVIDKSVRRILTQMEKFGLLDGGTASVSIDSIKADSAAAAKRVAVEGAVLLRNENSVLPLSIEQLKDAVIIGPSAYHAIIGGGGSSQVDTFTRVSPLQAFEARTGSAPAYFDGIDIEGEVIPAASLRDLDGSIGGLSIVGGGIDTDGVDETLSAGSSTTWQGKLVITEAGSYDIKMHTKGGQGIVYIGSKEGRGTDPFTGAPLSDVDTAGLFGGISLLPTKDGRGNGTFTTDFEVGEYDIEVTGNAGVTSILTPQTNSELDVRLTWVTPAMRQQKIDEASAAAAAAEEAGTPVIIFAYNEGTEGEDRQSLNLPNRQNALINAVTAANPNTIIVLNTGDPVSMPWKDQTGAILEMWYSGQEGAEATADLLLGVANPSGKLPVTFPIDLESGIATDPNDYPGVNNEQEYSEGIFVGYRWYDEQNKKPLFPFGHGLSYTEFEYSEQKITANKDGGYKVSFKVTNTGGAAGADVAQVYLGAPAKAPVAMAVKSLAGFSKVKLGSGKSASVSIDIKPKAFKYWSAAQNGWVTASGKRDVYLGHSSDDYQSIGTVTFSD